MPTLARVRAALALGVVAISGSLVAAATSLAVPEGPAAHAILVASYEAKGAASVQDAMGDLPHRLILQDEEGASVRLVVDYEVIYDPKEEATFANPLSLYLSPDGRQFYWDARDNDFKVLSDSNEFLYSFGGRGGAPGQWTSIPVAAGFSPDGFFYVVDRLGGRLIVYSLDGEFQHNVTVPFRISDASGLLFLSSDELLFGGLSFAPDYYGFVVHRMKIVDRFGVHELAHVSSFAEVPRYDPGVYGVLGAATVRFDRDGGVLVNNRTSYGLRKYTADGELLWSVDDPAAFPPAVDTLSTTPMGKVRVTPFAQSVVLLPISAGYYLHFVFFPPRDLPRPSGVVSRESLDLSGVKIQKVIELIPQGRPIGERIRINTTEDLFFTEVDEKGRFYGFLNFADPTLIRGRLTIEWQ